MLERLFHWQCDYCTNAIQQKNYGLPDGWIYRKANVSQDREIQHACGACKKDVPKAEWGEECLDVG